MARALSLWLPLFLLCANPARADWQIVSSEQRGLGRADVVHLEIMARESEGGDRATLHLAVFSTNKATLRVIDDPPEAQADLTGTMQREQCIAGVNGGYFDPEDKPVGLLIADGRLVAPLRKARLLSGVVSVLNGRVRIQRSTEFSLKTKPMAARQCGPFLVDGGRPIVGLNDTRAARRSFAITGGTDRAAIGYSSHVTLAQLAGILATAGLASGLTIDRALNLDGGSSSAFWFAGEGRPFSIREQKRVRDYLAIVPK